jgi:hypothetical protein
MCSVCPQLNSCFIHKFKYTGHLKIILHYTHTPNQPPMHPPPTLTVQSSPVLTGYGPTGVGSDNPLTTPDSNKHCGLDNIGQRGTETEHNSRQREGSLEYHSDVDYCGSILTSCCSSRLVAEAQG